MANRFGGEGLVKRISRGVGVGVIGISSLFGCVGGYDPLLSNGGRNSEGSNEALLGLGLMGAGYARNNPGAMAAGRAMVDYGAARAGRSEVNVNNNSYGNLQGLNRSPQVSDNVAPNPEVLKRLETARRDGICIVKWIDRNGNDRFDIKSDYVEDTNKFNLGDRAGFVVPIPSGVSELKLVVDNIEKIDKSKRDPVMLRKGEIPISEYIYYIFSSNQFRPDSDYTSGVFEIEARLFLENKILASKRFFVDNGLPRKEGAFDFTDHELGQTRIAACNYFRDFNNDGVFNFPDEFAGIKKRFSNKEKITLYVGTSQLTDVRFFGYSIMDSSGKGIVKKESNSSELEKTAEKGYGIILEYEPGELKPGTYTGVFTYKNRFLKKLEIEVTQD